MFEAVRIERDAWSDFRFLVLAFALDLDPEVALIRCAHIWAWQTAHYTDEQPTYVVDPELIEKLLRPIGPKAVRTPCDALIRSQLGEATSNGIRIKGSRGRIEWKFRAQVSGRRGGENSKRRHDDARAALISLAKTSRE